MPCERDLRLRAVPVAGVANRMPGRRHPRSRDEQHREHTTETIKPASRILPASPMPLSIT
jgi:hypothetical protein